MATDNMWNTFIATYWRNGNSDIPKYSLVYFNGAHWDVKQISHRKKPFSLGGTGTKRIPMPRPQVVVDKKAVLVIFRDEEKGNRISIASIRAIKNGTWIISDFSKDDYGQWEPSYNTELWRNKTKLRVFLQQTGQGDGEKTENMPPKMVKIIIF